MSRLLLALTVTLLLWFLPPLALAAPSPQTIATSQGAVLRLAGTPHLWIADEQGVLHWAGDTRALSGKVIDWSAQYEVSLDQLLALRRGDPWLSAGLLKLGEPIYFVKWESGEPQPTLLHIQAITDVELFGINSSNYGAMVLERGEWERRFGFNADTLAKGVLAPASPPGATREHPIPRGTSADTGDGWRITVLSVTPNATAAVLAANRYNTPPAPGYQFYIARVHIARTAPASQSFVLGGLGGLRTVGASGVAYSTYENSCGVVPDPLTTAEVFPGGAIVGNVCWQVRSSDVSSLVLYYDWYASSVKHQRLYFALGS